MIDCQHNTIKEPVRIPSENGPRTDASPGRTASQIRKILSLRVWEGCAMAYGNNHSQLVCFGFETAVTIMAAIIDRGLSLPKSRRRNYPNHAPSSSTRNESLLALEESLPGVTLCGPAHLVSCSSKRFKSTGKFVSHRFALTEGVTGLAQLSDNVLVSSVPLALAQISAGLTFVKLLERAYEYCGTYRCGRDGSPTQFNTVPLTSKREIASFIRSNPHVPGAARLRKILPYLTDKSASPRETKCAILFGLPVCRGGYGLGIPTLNHKVTCSPAARAIAETRTLRCDLFWEEANLDLEYQSREFHSGERHRIRDSRRSNALRSMGITMVSITDDELDSLYACDGIAKTLKAQLGKRSRVDRRKARSRNLALRRSLGLPLESRRTFKVDAGSKE